MEAQGTEQRSHGQLLSLLRAANGVATRAFAGLEVAELELLGDMERRELGGDFSLEDAEVQQRLLSIARALREALAYEVGYKIEAITYVEAMLRLVGVKLLPAPTTVVRDAMYQGQRAASMNVGAMLRPELS